MVNRILFFLQCWAHIVCGLLYENGADKSSNYCSPEFGIGQKHFHCSKTPCFVLCARHYTFRKGVTYHYTFRVRLGQWYRARQWYRAP